MRWLWALLFCGLFGFVNPLWPAQGGPLRQIQSIVLPNVRGRIDHLAVDTQGGRLFVSALENDTLEIINLRAGKLLRTLAGLQEPQGVLYVPGINKIFVDGGGDGTCKVFDATSYRLLDTIRFPSDADDIRYDPSRKLVYLGYGGHGNAGLGIVSAATDKVVAKIPLPSHPEAFSISPSRIFVNIPSAGDIIAVVDRQKRIAVSRWTIEGARENFPMALDRADHRLFIVTRQPARLVVFDSSSGREVARLPCVGVADDAYYDPQRKFIYISGGEGFLDVFKQDDPDHYHVIQRVKTSPGARTSLFVPKLNRLYLAVPRRGTQPAEVRTYEATVALKDGEGVQGDHPVPTLESGAARAGEASWRMGVVELPGLRRAGEGPATAVDLENRRGAVARR